MESKEDPYKSYLASFVAAASGGEAGFDTDLDKRVLAAIAIGFADGLQAQALAGQVGAKSPSDLVKTEKVLLAEVDKRLAA